jgi:hypothetical protein
MRKSTQVVDKRLRRVLKIGAYTLGIAAFVAIIACSKREDKPSADCDGREAERDHWIDTQITDLRDATPRQLGFRALGSCSEKITSVQLSCDLDNVRSIESDSPYLRRALDLGFKIYVCEKMGSTSRVEYNLADIVR